MAAAADAGTAIVHLQFELFLYGGPTSLVGLAPALGRARWALGGASLVTTMHQVVDPATVDGRYTQLHRVGAPAAVARAGLATLQSAVSVALGDEARFRSLWEWTDEHLQREDGLFACRWSDGGIVDYQPAADADLLVASALAMAADRFDDDDLRVDAQLVNDAVVAHETVALGERRVLLAGPWAERERVVNPSYFVPSVMSQLWWSLGATHWERIAADSREMLDSLTSRPPHLPPDWATVDESGGNPDAEQSPAGDSVRYGYEAGRVLVQLAVDCNGRGQRIAARAWPFLERELDDEQLVASYTLDGQPIDSGSHPLALMAAAASAAAAGEAERSADLLDDAADLDEANPSYYGAAWIALARLWIDTDLLGGCRPGDPNTP